MSYSRNKRHKIKQVENQLKGLEFLIHRAIQKTITDLEKVGAEENAGISDEEKNEKN